MSIDISGIRGEYPVLSINDAGHSFNLIAFYVLKKQYDVYKLAFKEFIG